MDADRLAKLTEQQRACLRLVSANMTSKEIAPYLGIEPGSVDQHIKAAMRILGVGDRRAAARLLAEYEGRASFQHLVYQSPDIDPAPDPATLAASSESARRRGGSTGKAMQEEQADFEVLASPPRPRWLRPPLPIGGGKPSDLRPLQRLAWIFAIMLAIAFSFGAFLAGLEALSRLGRGGS